MTKQMTKKLGQLDTVPKVRVEAIVVFGRRDRVEILHHYLQKQLRIKCLIRESLSIFLEFF